MAKLDEITELLTDELDGLKQMLVKLEQLSKELTSSETVQDISWIKYELKEIEKNQKAHFQNQNSGSNKVEEQLKKSQIIPEWLLFMVCLVLILSLSFSGYLGYQVAQFSDEKAKAFEEGKSIISTELKAYFSEHPETYKGFLEWSETLEIPDQK